MREIIVAGLGLKEDDMPLGTSRLLSQGRRVVLRTGKCGAAQWLSRNGMPFDTLDALYDEIDDFDRVNEEICEKLVHIAQGEDIVYGVLDVRDLSVPMLLEKAERVRVIPGVPVDGALTAFATGRYQAVSASDWEAYQPESSQGALIREIDTRQLASEIKLRLMDRYPEESPAVFLGAEGIRPISLCDLDRQEAYDHTTCAFVPAQDDLKRLERFGFGELNRIMRILRGPDGCPWDKKQTHESLRASLVEEAYEAVEAIDEGDTDALYDELGDVLLQVALHAEIARQHGEFTSDDVTSAICRKMISRHAHIFGNERADTAEEVSDLWEKIKRQERKQTGAEESMLSVAKSMPSLMRAQKVLKKAFSAGFGAGDAGTALGKVIEETREVTEAVSEGNDAHIREELGDLLLAVSDAARVLKQDGELSLNAACDKFIGRFTRGSRIAREKGLSFEAMTAAQRDECWEMAKSCKK